ncbi:MAG: HD-GYP domain-containing protein [Solirubrobacteraceae bacterium]
MMRALTEMRLLIIDDNAANVELIEQVLQHAGYTELLGTQDPEGAAHLCETWKPDLVLLDLHMPALSGFEVIAAIRELMREPENLPVLVITADDTPDARHRALSMGARDFITKPIDQTELLLRTSNLLQTRQLQQQLQDRNAFLDEAVRERTLDLEHARLESLTILASVAEYHDDDTHQHTQRVGLIAALIAQALELPEQFVAMIRDAAPLHDIGKIAISRRILLKPDWLTPAEREHMMRHVEIGAGILATAQSPVLRLACEIAGTHHERWDGRGYLAGLAGEAIPLAGRITAVADVFDALTHRRPYKPAWEIGHALTEIAEQSGQQFDPRVASAFATLDHDALSRQDANEAAHHAA